MNDDRALHELRVIEKKSNELFPVLGVGFPQAEGLELLVLPHQLGRLVGEQIEEALEVGTGKRRLQVLDDIELDAALTQDVQCAA